MVATWKPVILGRFPTKVNSDLTAVNGSWQATLRNLNQLIPFAVPIRGRLRNRKAVVSADAGLVLAVLILLSELPR